MEPTTFAELGLSAKVLTAITDAGYTTPTPIQAQAIPVAMTGRDVLGIAQTGTGKTAAFVMPMISRLEAGRARARMPRSLIMAPTRELAAQVAQSFENYGKNHKLSVALLIGGVSMDDQVAKLDRGADVLIATPGRLLDHFGRGRVMLMGVEILVIDEADRMLDMGFIPDIEKICKLLPPKRQTLFFSATMPPEITRLVDQFLHQPTRIEVAKPATTAKTITQRFVFCRNGEDWAKRELLRDLIREQTTIKNAIIFCNRKRDVAILLKSLQKHGFNAGALHGDMDQMSRTATLDKFRAGEIQLLAASDVAARGLDIPDVSHVINFDVPWQGDDYVHRIGRTGRAGREGFSATLVAMDDLKAVKEIEKITGEAAVWIGEAPSEQELAEGATRKRRRGASSGGRDDRRSGGRDRDRGGRDKGARDGARDAGGRDRRPPHVERRDDNVAAEATGEIEAIVGESAQPVQDKPEDNRERSRSRRRGGTGRPNRNAQPQSGEVQSQVDQQPLVAKKSAPDGRPARRERPQGPGRVGLRETDRDRGRDTIAPRQLAQEGGDERPPERGDERRAQRVDERRPPRRERTREDRARPDEATRARDQRPVAADAERRERHPGRRDDLGPRVGFEDNIPAFLRRPAR